VFLGLNLISWSARETTNCIQLLAMEGTNPATHFCDATRRATHWGQRDTGQNHQSQVR
jgi:hypothetical protein